MQTQTKQTPSTQFKRERKMMLTLPVILWPLLAFAFHVLGGGAATAASKQNETGKSGYNKNLPGARFDKKEGGMDKLALYNKADRDSARMQDQVREDPYHMQSSVSGPINERFSMQGLKGGQDTNADAILRRLNLLKLNLRQPELPSGPQLTSPGMAPPLGVNDPIPKINLLENSLRAAGTPESPIADRQLEKYDSLLDKIMKIQRPAKDISPEKSDGPGTIGPPLTLDAKKEEPSVRDLSGDLDPNPVFTETGPAFYSIDENNAEEHAPSNLIKAIVPQAQTVVTGATLMLRLTEDAIINGIVIPRNNTVSGKVSWQNDRLMVNIVSIRYKNSEYAVALKVFDTDGLEGLNIPGSISRDVLKESADQGVGTMGLTSLDPSIGAQAATAGIQAAKTLFSRNIKLVRANVPAGYQVFLQSTKNQTR